MKLIRLVSNAVVTLLIVLAASPVLAQTENKVVEWFEAPFGSRPATAAPHIRLFRQIDGVEIESIAVNGKPITVGEPFTADDDWLKNLTVRVRNISDHPLVGMQLTLILPEMKVPPQIAFCYPCVVGEKGKNVMPGEEMTLVMPAGPFYEWVRNAVAKERPLSQITKARIYMAEVRLPDGVKWVSGCVKTADPRNTCPNLSAP